jgi:hypothetical protein
VIERLRHDNESARLELAEAHRAQSRRRRQSILRHWELNPGITMRELGAAFGVGREWAANLLRRARLERTQARLRERHP